MHFDGLLVFGVSAKKYVIILIRSEIDDSNGGKDLLVDTVTYEI